MDGFEWDEGNTSKNWIKHGVNYKECEEVFFNETNVVYKDIKHSFAEDRYGILGKTNSGRLLHVIFTTRNGKVRVISARDQNHKERKYYESKQKNSK